MIHYSVQGRVCVKRTPRLMYHDRKTFETTYSNPKLKHFGPIDLLENLLAQPLTASYTLVSYVWYTHCVEQRDKQTCVCAGHESFFFLVSPLNEN